nr:universal stress protein [uncultured Sulfurimonas sp.]
MNSFNNIILGLNISNNAQNILNRAFLLAKMNNSEVVVTHAVDVGFFGKFITEEKLEKLKDSAIVSVKKELEKTNTQGVKYSIEVENAKPSDFVIQVAKDREASLIIIGANEKKDFATKILGSTAHNIAQKSNLPLLIVKNNSTEEYKNIVAFTDLSEVSQKSLAFSRDFFNQKDIKCVYAYKKMSEIDYIYHDEIENKDEIEKEVEAYERGRFDEFVKENNLTNTELIEERIGATNAIMTYVNKNNNDLVTLGSSGINSVGSFLYGSTSSYLMQNLTSDILVYIPKK